MYACYPACFYKDLDADGYYVLFPDIEGAGTCGDNEKDSYYMAQDYLGCVLYDYYIQNECLPKATDFRNVTLDPSQSEFADLNKSFISLVGLDVGDYVKKVDKKTVKKNLTIPSYLNEMGKNLNVNFSQILTDALKSEFDLD